MSALTTEYHASVAMFFWLNIPEATLRKILRDAGFAEAMAPPPKVSIAPGVEIALGPPRRPLASYKSVRISWDDVKFLLAFEGVVGDVVEALKAVGQSFSRHGYPLDKICHYYEVSFEPQPLDIDNFVTKLREKLGIGLRIGDEVLKPFSISFSNEEEPISKESFYRWFHIIINPDVNAPQKRIYVQVIKREVDFHLVLKFIEDIDKILESIRKYFA
ncbi:MAG: hypothetical protein QXQ57_00665 [Sulfolobales archaeon]